MTLDRDSAATDALLTDLYVDALLAGAILDAAAGRTAGLRRGGTPNGFADLADSIDPSARRVAERLRRDLARVHPSFRFEERLATRLAEAAVALRLPLAAGAEGRIVPFPGGPSADVDPGLGPDAGASGGLIPAGSAPGLNGVAAGVLTSDLDPAHRPAAARPLLIGGALTSAALSIAGAAFVAWRLGRPGRASTPMARAARAVRDARLSAASPARGLD